MTEGAELSDAGSNIEYDDLFSTSHSEATLVRHDSDDDLFKLQGEEVNSNVTAIASGATSSQEDVGGGNPQQKTEILVSDPKKVGDGMSAYIVFKVTTRTNVHHFRRYEMIVSRRFSDFIGLYDKLVQRYQSKGIVVPPPPEKSVIGMTVIKVVKEESGSLDFVERRRAALERFLNRIARHPTLNCDADFVDFVELDDELPKVTSSSTLSGASLVRWWTRVGDSISKLAYGLPETDDWLEDRTEQLELMHHDLQELHASVDVLVMHRKDLSQSTQQVSSAIALLGTAEEHMTLSRALSRMSDVTSEVSRLQADQADVDFYIVSELVKDYISVIHAVKDVLAERARVYRAWKDAESCLKKKQDERIKVEQQHRADKLSPVDREISELEHRVVSCRQQFDEMTQTVRSELERFDRQKVDDFKSAIINYLQCIVNYQQQVVRCWEAALPDMQTPDGPSAATN